MKNFQATTCAVLLTVMISSTALAGNIGGMRTNSAGNIGGMRGNAVGNIGGPSTEEAKDDGQETGNATPDLVLSIYGIYIFLVIVISKVGGLFVKM